MRTNSIAIGSLALAGLLVTTSATAQVVSGSTSASPGTPAPPKAGDGAPSAPVTPPATSNADAARAGAGTGGATGLNAAAPPSAGATASPSAAAAAAPSAAATASPSAAAAPATPTAPSVTPAPFSSDWGVVKGKWSATLYGWAHFFAAHDTTQSYSDSPGGNLIARPGTYTGDHDRTQASPRSSRIGFRFAVPELWDIKTSGLVEFDFYGNQPSLSYPAGTGVSEQSFFVQPTPRLRHAAIRLENPYVNVLIGQYWQILGWEMNYVGTSVEGLPGPGAANAGYRTPQVRLYRTVPLGPINLDLAASVNRPGSRNSAIPDGQAGVRLVVNDWKGVTGFPVFGIFQNTASIGVSGILRRFRVPNFEASPHSAHHATGGGISVDALLPIIPRTVKDPSHALNVNGGFLLGTGIADSMVATGGIGFQSLPVPAGSTTAPTYPQDIDNGLVTYNKAGELKTIDWRGYSLGVTYVAPPSGHIWLSFNYANAHSENLANLGFDPSKVAPDEYWFSANAFLSLHPLPFGFGVGFSRYQQKYADGVVATNDRVSVASWLSFL